MTAEVVVIALGCRAAGDDGVGPRILAELRARSPRGLALHEAGDAAHLASWLCEGGRAILVDAVLGVPAGQVIEPAVSQLAAHRRGPAVAVHGIGAAAAIDLAHALARRPLELRIVGVTIAAPVRTVPGLSDEVAAAIPAAVERVLAIAREYCASPSEDRAP